MAIVIGAIVIGAICIIGAILGISLGLAKRRGRPRSTCTSGKSRKQRELRWGRRVRAVPCGRAQSLDRIAPSTRDAGSERCDSPGRLR